MSVFKNNLISILLIFTGSVIITGSVRAEKNSELLRMDKSMSVTADLLGTNSLPGAGLTGGLYLSPNTLMEAGYRYSWVNQFFMDLKASIFESV